MEKGQRGPTPETHDQVWSTVAQTQRGGESRPDRGHFDGLIQVRVADAERRGLKRKALVAPADLDPVPPVAGFGHEDRDAGRVPDLAGIGLVLGLRRVEQAHHPAAQPPQNGRIAHRGSEQAVPGARSLFGAEADPGLQLLDERRIVHLRCVGGDHVLQHVFHGGSLGQQQHANASARSRTFQQPKLLCGEQLAIEVAAGALASGNRLEQRGCQRLRRPELQVDGSGTGRVAASAARLTRRLTTMCSGLPVIRTPSATFAGSMRISTFLPTGKAATSARADCSGWLKLMPSVWRVVVHRWPPAEKEHARSAR